MLLQKVQNLRLNTGIPTDVDTRGEEPLQLRLVTLGTGDADGHLGREGVGRTVEGDRGDRIAPEAALGPLLEGRCRGPSDLHAVARSSIVQRTPELSCEAPIVSGFVSFNSLFDDPVPHLRKAISKHSIQTFPIRWRTTRNGSECITQPAHLGIEELVDLGNPRAGRELIASALALQ